jgi:hypothetical protein
MRRLVMAVIAAVVLVPASAAAADKIEGELVTIMCVAKNGEKGQGAAHVDCAIDCATKGYPLAILTADGTMYKVTGALTADNNAKLQPLLAAKVTATGHISSNESEQTDKTEKSIEADTIVRAKN